MSTQNKELALRQLDKKLAPWRELSSNDIPPKGWIKAIREAIGMKPRQLAKRMGISQPRVVKIEKDEPLGSIKLDTLERAARAMNCRVVYAIVPDSSLANIVNGQARKKARRTLQATDHSMALENQKVSSGALEEEIEIRARQLIENDGSTLWEDS